MHVAGKGIQAVLSANSARPSGVTHYVVSGGSLRIKHTDLLEVGLVWKHDLIVFWCLCCICVILAYIPLNMHQSVLGLQSNNVITL